jgi:uncharacterized protein
MGIFQDFGLINTVLIFFAAFIIGITKAGLKGLDLLTVTVTAFVFGSKQSTGIILPLLIIGDILAVIYYRRNAKWPLFWKLISWMSLGILFGVYFGNGMAESFFKKLFAFIILGNICLMIWFETRKADYNPKNILFVPTIGLLAGFTSMIGNLAGGFSNIYFMAQRISKNDFIGTAAWVFLVINLFKLPFQVVFWKNINANTLQIGIWMVPIEIIGFATGIYLVDKIKDENYRKIVIALSILGAFTLIFR